MDTLNRKSTPAPALIPRDGSTPGTTVKIREGALDGDIYEFVGPEALTDSDPDVPEEQDFDLSQQQYRDATL